MSTVRAEIAAALRGAGTGFDPNHSVAPAIVLWPDPNRAWESVIHALQEAVPILVLGPRDPKAAQGPAIWVRAVLATWRDDPRPPILDLPTHLKLPDSANPWVLYLPGLSREDLEQATATTVALAPLVELQHRGVWWLQSNRRPWTPRTVLSKIVGLTVATDADTKGALDATLDELVKTTVERLRSIGQLDAERIHSLRHPDTVKDLLGWINDPVAARNSLGAGWPAFRSLCRNAYQLDPVKKTPIDAARLLGRREGSWAGVWARYVEAPSLYPHLPERLDQAAPALTLFNDADPHPDSWPTRNAEAENELRDALTAVAQLPDAGSARNRIAELAADHSARLGTVWDRLGRSPLAHAIDHLGDLVQKITPMAGATVLEVATWYTESGWRVDDNALRALAAVQSLPDREAVRAALGATYDPWLDEVASAFQIRATAGYPAETGLATESGTCVVFVDALRMDLGHRLQARFATDLVDLGAAAQLSHRIAAFPTVTPTGQPAVAPLSMSLSGGSKFSAADDASRDVQGVVLSKLLAADGVQFLAWAEDGDPTGRAWTQTSEIDNYGHAHHHALASEVDRLLNGVAERVATLIAAGWRQVVVVTDHGWMLPAQPARKVELPLHLTPDKARKPRVARLRTGNTSDYPSLGWTWDDNVTMVSAPGAAAFVAGTFYEHGGLSPQECVIPVLTIGVDSSGVPVPGSATEITGVKWIGQRCRIDIFPPSTAVTVELRIYPGDRGSSLVKPRPVTADGEARLLVDEERAPAGTPVHVVVLDDSGAVLAQRETTVGGAS